MTAKAKLKGEKPFKLTVDWENCMPLLPALDIKWFNAVEQKIELKITQRFGLLLTHLKNNL